jgi:hypothetical protein
MKDHMEHSIKEDVVARSSCTEDNGIKIKGHGNILSRKYVSHLTIMFGRMLRDHTSINIIFGRMLISRKHQLGSERNQRPIAPTDYAWKKKLYHWSEEKVITPYRKKVIEYKERIEKSYNAVYWSEKKVMSLGEFEKNYIFWGSSYITIVYWVSCEEKTAKGC